MKKTGRVQTPVGVPARGRPVLSQDAKTKRQNDIADVALRLFLDEGYAAVSMRRLGKEVGLSPMALYRYYPSKLDILAQIWGYILMQAFGRVSEATQDCETHSDALHRAATAYVTYWLDNRAHYHLVFMNAGVGQEDVQSFVGDAETIAKYDVFFKHVAGVLCEELSSPSVKAVTDGLICNLHGIMHSLITMQGYVWTDSQSLIDYAVSRL